MIPHACCKVKAYFENDLIWALGPAGTGKTYIAIALAVRALKNREIKRITFSDLVDRDEKKYGLNGSPTQVQRIFPPAVNDKREMLRGDAQTVGGSIAEKLKELKFV